MSIHFQDNSNIHMKNYTVELTSDELKTVSPSSLSSEDVDHILTLSNIVAKMTGEESIPATIELEANLPFLRTAFERVERFGDCAMMLQIVAIEHKLDWWRGRIDCFPRLEKTQIVAARVQHIFVQAYVLWAQGDLLRQVHRYSEADARFKESIFLYRQVDDELGIADCLKGMAEVLRRTDRHDEALVTFQAAQRLYGKNGDALGVANCIKGQADSYRRKDDMHRAIALFSDALERYTEIGDLFGVANCIKGKAEVYRTKGIISESLKYFTLAYGVYVRIGARLGMAHTLRGAGDTYWMRGSYVKAIKNYSEAVSIYKTINEHSPGLARAYFGLAEACRRGEEFQQSVYWLEKAEEQYHELGNRFGIARCLRSRADMLRKKPCATSLKADSEHLTEAIELYKQAQQIFADVGSPLGIGDCLRGMAGALRDLERLEDAFEAYHQAMEHYEQIDAGLGKVYCLCGKGKTYISCRQYIKAINAFQSAEELVNEMEGKEAEKQRIRNFVNDTYQLFETEEAMNEVKKQRSSLG